MTQTATESSARRPRAGRWTLDPAASTVVISHKSMWNLVTVKGTFADVAGEGTVDPGSALSGTLQIRTASLDTGNGKRDKHLKSADFFDADSYPEISFRSSSVTLEGSTLRITGMLTVHGVTEAVTLTGVVTALVEDTAVLTVDTTIERARFGLSWNRLGMIRGNAAVSIKAVYRQFPA